MRFDYLPAAAGFLEPDRVGADRPDDAKAVIIPFGLEASVSYGSGTARGPEAILRSSHQLELFDEELWCEPHAAFGVATLRPWPIPEILPAALDQLAAIVGDVLAQDRFPLVLGGEHALTAGAIRPFVARYPDLAVLQIDAHADLRDGYLGEHFSHAAAMRRVLDHASVSLIQVGIRAISAGELPFWQANQDRIQTFFAKDWGDWDIEDIVASLAGRPIYVTFDVDGLDPSVMPATGTPEPGGLFWGEACAVLKAASEVGTIVGGDIVELAPIPGLHYADYTAARLAYKLLGYALCARPQATD